jgi:uncharacterized protein YodC (DUF2158 family)
MRQGDKVRHVTGGPVMTVDMAVIQMVFVHWDVEGWKQEGFFPQEDLVLVEAVRQDSDADA